MMILSWPSCMMTMSVWFQSLGANIIATALVHDGYPVAFLHELGFTNAVTALNYVPPIRVF